jgi:hypothetical protein
MEVTKWVTPSTSVSSNKEKIYGTIGERKKAHQDGQGGIKGTLECILT